MPVVNMQDAELLSPMGEFLAEMAHVKIKEKLFIGDEPCKKHPEEHEGIFYEEAGECFECSFRETHHVGAYLGMQTFMDKLSQPKKYRTFIGRFDHDPDGDVAFGASCKRCETNLRYVEGNLCVFCAGQRLAELGGIEAMREWRDLPVHPIPITPQYDRFLRKIAAADDQQFYEGKLCPKDKTRIRHTQRGQCAECVKRENKLSWERVKRRAAAGFPAAASDEFDSMFD